MSQITWKNVDAPSNATAALMQKNSQEMITGAFDRGAEALEGMHQRNVDRNTGDAMAQLAQMNDIGTFDQDKAALLSGLDMGNIDQERFMEAMMGRQDTLDKRDQFAFEREHRDDLMAMEKSALSARINASNRSGRGGGGGGGGGGGRGGAAAGGNGATEVDMLYNAFIHDPEIAKLDPNQQESRWHDIVAKNEYSSREGSYTYKNRHKGGQDRFNKEAAESKKNFSGSGNKAANDAMLGSAKTEWFGFGEASTEEATNTINRIRMMGGKEADVGSLIGKNMVGNRIDKKGIEKDARDLEDKLKINRGTD